jgi:hypothetical protein
MTCDRKKPGVAFWATVVVVAVLVGNPLSFGAGVLGHEPREARGACGR